MTPLSPLCISLSNEIVSIILIRIQLRANINFNFPIICVHDRKRIVDLLWRNYFGCIRKFDAHDERCPARKQRELHGMRCKKINENNEDCADAKLLVGNFHILCCIYRLSISHKTDSMQFSSCFIAVLWCDAILMFLFSKALTTAAPLPPPAMYHAWGARIEYKMQRKPESERWKCNIFCQSEDGRTTWYAAANT